MAIKFRDIMTAQSNYSFRIARFGDKFIIAETDLFEYPIKSLTNSIEEVIEHIILGCPDNEEAKRIEIYQYGKDGIFKIDWYLSRKITRDYPPWVITDVKWTYVSKDLAAFEVLYGT